MKSFIVTLVIVGAVCVFGYVQERAEHRQLVQDVMSGKVPVKFGQNEGIKEAYIERAMESTLFYESVGGTIFYWLFTSGLVWGGWKLVAAAFRTALRGTTADDEPK